MYSNLAQWHQIMTIETSVGSTDTFRAFKEICSGAFTKGSARRCIVANARVV